MEISSIFESWLIGDGAYPMLSIDDEVNLSFEVQFSKIKKSDNQNLLFKHISFAEYKICAKVIRRYDNDGNPLFVFDARLLKFYSLNIEIKDLKDGDFITGKGTLLFDHYIWVENLDSYNNPPNLFYNFKVNKILKAKMPEQFISRHSKGKALPTMAALLELPQSNIEEISAMKNEKFYVIVLNSERVENKTIKKTFVM